MAIVIRDDHEAGKDSNKQPKNGQPENPLNTSATGKSQIAIEIPQGPGLRQKLINETGDTFATGAKIIAMSARWTRDCGKAFFTKVMKPLLLPVTGVAGIGAAGYFGAETVGLSTAATYGMYGVAAGAGVAASAVTSVFLLGCSAKAIKGCIKRIEGAKETIAEAKNYVEGVIESFRAAKQTFKSDTTQKAFDKCEAKSTSVAGNASSAVVAFLSKLQATNSASPEAVAAIQNAIECVKEIFTNANEIYKEQIKSAIKQKIAPTIVTNQIRSHAGTLKDMLTQNIVEALKETASDENSIDVLNSKIREAAHFATKFKIVADQVTIDFDVQKVKRRID